MVKVPPRIRCKLTPSSPVSVFDIETGDDFAVAAGFTGTRDSVFAAPVLSPFKWEDTCKGFPGIPKNHTSPSIIAAAVAIKIPKNHFRCAEKI